MIVNETCVCLALRRATRRVTRLYDEALAPHGLTIGQLGILGTIHARSRNGCGPFIQELADAFEMDQSAMSRTLKPLKRAGLIDAAPEPDRRRRGVRLTAEGRSRMKAASQDWARVQRRILDELAEDAARLASILDRIGAE